MPVGNILTEERQQFHGNAEIGGWLFKEILSQLGVTEEEFNQLK